CSIENISLARKIGFPLRTRSGPPPIASVTSLQLGVSVSLMVSGVPAGASATSFAPPVPRPTITAPPSGIAVPPFVGPICATCADEDARGLAARSEPVAVDTGDGRSRRGPLLDRRQLLPSEDHVVRERRAERVEATRARRGDDVERDRAARRELHVVRVGDAR